MTLGLSSEAGRNGVRNRLLPLRTCDSALSKKAGVPAEATACAGGLVEPRCSKQRHRPKRDLSTDINGDDDSPERRRLGNLSLESVLREILKRRRLATVIRQADAAIIHARQATDAFEGDDQEEDLSPASGSCQRFVFHDGGRGQGEGTYADETADVVTDAANAP